MVKFKENNMLVKKEDMLQVLQEKLIKYGLCKEIAKVSAENFVENSLYGVLSHGVNRFPKVISYLEKGYIKPENKPSLVQSMGALEKWDGNLGMGNSNAIICMDRAVELAKEYGIGCVALKNTNHWMRAGALAVRGAKANCVGICWSNTMPNMPAWGGTDRRIGNNPMAIAVPLKDGGHVLVDNAMSQFSYGAIESAKLAGKKLPVYGGFDSEGNLSCDPVEIEKTWRVLPIGYWKGSGFSILLDMAVSLLSEGNSTSDIGKISSDEYGLSQIFIAINAESKGDVVERIIADIKSSQLVEGAEEILYPSERANKAFIANSQNGIEVNDGVWNKILAL